MDKDRQFRLLIPPFFLLASLVWEAYLGGSLCRYLNTTTAPNVASIFGVVGIATLPLGYAIGVLTMCVLRLFWPFFPNKSYEVPVSKAAMKKIRDKLAISEGSDSLSTAALFDHEFLPSSTHQWLFRRWSTFNICTQCVTALVLSYFFGLAFGVKPTCVWWLTIVLSTSVFVWQATTSWRESRKMFDLMADRDVAR
jgi:hypothetical protein